MIELQRHNGQSGSQNHIVLGDVLELIQMVNLFHSQVLFSLQVLWSARRERWSLGREGNYSLSMMSMRKLEGESASLFISVVHSAQ